jgi:hypothetical protein
MTTAALRTPHRTRPLAAAKLAFALAFVLGALGCSKRDAPSAAGTHAQAAATTQASQGTPGVQAAAPARRQLLEIKVEMDADLTDSKAKDAVLERLERIAADNGGFVAGLTNDGEGVAKLSLRVPPSQIPAIRAQLREGAKIAREQQTATDVTDAVADLDARLRVARAEEARLLELLEKRTGSMADVLAAEKALADVRERVERIEATQRVAVQRVELATVDIKLRAARAAEPEPSIMAKLAAAGRNGVEVTGAILLGAAQVALTLGPTALMLALLGGAMFGLARRVARRRATLAA